jgi:hypothetical protein
MVKGSVLALVCLVATVGSAHAQIVQAQPLSSQVGTAVPAPGMTAAGVSLGISGPGDDRLSNGLALSVWAERYMTRRVSFRGMVSGSWWGVIDGPDGDGVSPISAKVNLVYNWERGKWHPYATAGLGLYKFRFTEDDVDSSATTVGFNIGGGAEYFIRLRDTIVVEALIHPLVGNVESRFDTYVPWFWTLSGGYKKYF